jgi:hypothetical protein
MDFVRGLCLDQAMENATPPESESSKQAIELGWNWFKYHAEQRMLMIRYYLIIVGGALAAYSAALKEFPLISASAALFGLVASALFWALDRRVSKLIKLGENVLAREQEKLKAKLGYGDIAITELANRSSCGVLGSYKRIFGIFFLVVIALSAVGGTAAILQYAPPKPAPIGKTP